LPKGLNPKGKKNASLVLLYKVIFKNIFYLKLFLIFNFFILSH